MSGDTGENEATNNPAEGEIVQQGSSVEATKRVVVSLFDRKCSNCGKKSKLTLGQMRMAKNGRLITRCCSSKFITPEQVDWKQKAAANKKLDARIDALPVTEAMVKAVLKGFGSLKRTKPYTHIDRRGSHEIPAGWEIIDRKKMCGIFTVSHDCPTIGQAYMKARGLAGLSTDIGLVEKELRGEQ
jgi:hypothetical protein